MRRDPREVTQARDPDDERRISGRAWGVVLGLWAAFFTFLALVGAPLLFSLCEANR